MTRLDENGDGAKISLNREELKEEIRKEVRHEARRRFFFSLALYLAFLIVLVGVPLAFSACAIAKTGLYDVPLLSAWFYDPPAPTRIVIPLVGSGSDVILNSMAAKASYDPARGIVGLTLSEQELTTLIGTSFSEASDSGALPLPVGSVQTVLLGDGTMELSAIIEREGNRAPVILNVIPEAIGGRLELKTVDLRIGSLSVPVFISDLLLGAFISSITDGLEDGLSGIGTLDDIAVEEGKIRIYLAPEKK